MKCGRMAPSIGGSQHWQPCTREQGHLGGCAHRPTTAHDALHKVLGPQPWKPNGIDVEKLTKAADEVLTLTRAEELAQLASSTMKAAVAKQRKKYLKRWARFFACELCGNRDFKGGARCAKCDGTFVEHRRDQ